MLNYRYTKIVRLQTNGGRRWFAYNSMHQKEGEPWFDWNERSKAMHAAQPNGYSDEKSAYMGYSYPSNHNTQYKGLTPKYQSYKQYNIYKNPRLIKFILGFLLYAAINPTLMSSHFLILPIVLKNISVKR